MLGGFLSALETVFSEIRLSLGIEGERDPFERLEPAYIVITTDDKSDAYAPNEDQLQ